MVLHVVCAYFSFFPSLQLTLWYSLSTEGIETCQHCHFARYHTHFYQSNICLWICGEHEHNITVTVLYFFVYTPTLHVHVYIYKWPRLHSCQNCIIVLFLSQDTDLSHYMEKHPGPLDPKNVQLFMFQLLRGLDFCHSRKILHRYNYILHKDLKRAHNIKTSTCTSKYIQYRSDAR